MSVKKATEKGKEKATKSAKKSAKNRVRSPKKPVDMARVRENINNLVRDSAKDIATEVIKVAKTGQLASARYLFEAVGLYPATEETAAELPVHSLAHTLLKRMGLPLDPVIVDEEPEPAALTMTSGGKGVARETARAAAEEDPVCEGEEAQEPDPENGEE